MESVAVTKNFKKIGYLSSIFDNVKGSDVPVYAEKLLNIISSKDVLSYRHMLRTYKLVIDFAKYLGINRSDTYELGIASLLHDIGKIGVPNYILTKTGKLSDSEFERIKRHPIIGYHLLRSIDLDMCAEIALYHHRFIDGSGYPDDKTLLTLANNIQTYEYYTKIVQICDIFEALTGMRHYKLPISTEDALEVLEKEFVQKNKIENDMFSIFKCYINMLPHSH